MSEGYLITKDERLGLYEMLERVYLSHENRIANLERIVSSLRQDVDKLKVKQYRPSPEDYRLSEIARKYYLMASETSRLFVPLEKRIESRTIPFEKAVKRISNFIKKNPNVTTTDIMLKSKLEPDLVNQVLFNLERKGQIRGEPV